MIDKSSVAEQIFIQLMNCTAAKCDRFPSLWNTMVLYYNVTVYLDKYFPFCMIIVKFAISAINIVPLQIIVSNQGSY